MPNRKNMNSRDDRSHTCPRCGETELNEKLTCPLCKQTYFKQGEKLLQKGVDSPIYQPIEGHPDVCDCNRREDGEIVWTDGCLEDGFVEYQKEHLEERREDRNE